MMKIGVVSDSHQNTENLEKAVKYLIDEKKVDKLIHLGDYFEDLENIQLTGFDSSNLLKTPGTHHYQYSDPALKRIRINFENLRFLISHVPRRHQNDTDEDISIENLIATQSIDVLLYGHTHEFRINYDNDNNILYINPGHLKDFDAQGAPPTFAYIEIDGGRLFAIIYNLFYFSLLERRYVIRRDNR